MSTELFDAVLLLSFGGPDGPEDVMPFLRNVTRGRDVSEERLAKVAEQYRVMGGASPINEQNRALLAAIQGELESRDLSLPLYWGNRNWHPLLDDTLRQMRADGIRRAAVLVTSGYSSYSGCRQYRENLFDAVVAVESDEQGLVPELEKMRLWFDMPGFIDAMTDNAFEAIDSFASCENCRLVFTTHSIPLAQAERSGPPTDHNAYQAQHRFVAQTIAQRLSQRIGTDLAWDLVFQSRSGPPSTPWLEPDVSDHLESLAQVGCERVVLIPIGFASDHAEVVWDLDTVAMGKARELGMACVRAATPGTDARFVSALVDTVVERQRDVPMSQRAALSRWGPWPDACPAGCCLGSDPARPALCGQDNLVKR